MQGRIHSRGMNGGDRMNPGDIVAPTMNYVVLFDRPLILGQSPEGTRIVGRARHDQHGLMLEE